MPNLFDYLTWRGDLSLEQVPLGPVDALILTAVCYVDFEGFVPSGPEQTVTLRQAAACFLSLSREEQLLRIRSRTDLELLERLSKSPRFAQLYISSYEDRLEEESELQFSAMAFSLGRQGTFLAYRGTDNSLVGWKEDFNMSFQDSVPAQWMARDYLERCAGWFPGPLILGGHSKGGNLAVFAASMCRPQLRARIKSVYTHDGPGFTDLVMEQEGYRQLLPRIRNFVPESSVVGMLLEHQEPYIVVKSRSIGVFQHDPYSWEVLGSDFIRLEDVSEGSRMLDQTLKNWLAGLSAEERSHFVDTIYDMLQTTQADRIQELVKPKNLYQILQAIKNESGENRRQVAAALGQLVKTAVQTIKETRKED